MSELKVVDFNYVHFYFYFYFLFDFIFYFSIFLFLELRVRVRVMRSCYHTSVTSDNTVTVIITSHETYREI